MSRECHDLAPTSDADLIGSFWDAIVRDGAVHEVRIPKTRRGPMQFYERPHSGYFSDRDRFITELQLISGHDAEGVYLTLNPVAPDLLARVNNSLRRAQATTSDIEIIARRHILIDIDPVRPSGISATDSEMRLAVDKAAVIRVVLHDLGWPQPAVVMQSGNGAALIYRVDLPNDVESKRLVERVLRSLDATFSDESVHVDPSVANAARLCKIAGTVAAKGDSIPARPWRTATATFPEDAGIVSVDRLESVAEWIAEIETPLPIRPGVEVRRDIRRALDLAGIGYRETSQPYATIFQLDRCLTSDDHDDGAVILEFPSGALAYRCLHNRCSQKRWSDVRGMLFDDTPPAPLRPIVNGIDYATGEIVNPARHSPEPVDDEPELYVSDLSEIPPIPGVCFDGFAGRYLELVEPTTEAPDAFHLACAMVLFGATMGRGIVAQAPAKTIYGNVLAVLVGETGRTRKDTSMDRMVAVGVAGAEQDRWIPPYEYSSDITSKEGLIQQIASQPNSSILFRFSELSTLFANARRQSTSGIIATILNAYDGRPLENNAKSGTIQAISPHFSMIAGTQPDVLSREITAEDIDRGFANRILWFPGGPKEPRPFPPRLDHEAAARLRREAVAVIDRMRSGVDGPTVVPASSDVVERWAAHYVETYHRFDDNPSLASLTQRGQEYAWKLALHLAVWHRTDRIELAHLEAGIALAEWQVSVARHISADWGRDRPGRIENRIVSVLRRYGSLPRRSIQMKSSSRQWSSEDFAKAFNAMAQNGTIIQTTDGNYSLVVEGPSHPPNL